MQQALLVWESRTSVWFTNLYGVHFFFPRYFRLATTIEYPEVPKFPGPLIHARMPYHLISMQPKHVRFPKTVATVLLQPRGGRVWRACFSR